MRKLGQILSLWLALLVYPVSGWALGLGEIEVNSFLNQPLKAEIPVISARPGEVDDLLVSLASRDAFQKAGLERSSNLSELRFAVEKSEDGQSARVKITTKGSIKEPFLNFLVEADWAKGRLLREFTVLLDPPHFAQQTAPAPAPAAPAPVPVAPVAAAPVTQPEPIPQPDPEPPRQQPIALAETPAPEADNSIPFVPDSDFLNDSAQQADPVASVDNSEIVVQKGDTLWQIASQFKTDEYSMAQIMLAMQATNPEAFADGNINNLKVGAVLRAPDQSTLDQLSQQEAYAQVLEQNGLWDEYVARVSGEPVVGSPAASEEVATESAAPEGGDGQLSLVTPGDDESTSAGLQSDSSGENVDQIRKQLALAEEELEAANLENDDLKSRISDLELQLEKFNQLEKLVEVEDTGLAQLYRRMQLSLKKPWQPKSLARLQKKWRLKTLKLP